MPVKYLSLLLLSGCVYSFTKGEDIRDVAVHKIETTVAPEFCTNLLGGLKRGCAVRIRNTETQQVSCVVVMLPNDGEAASHEAGHCLGYRHD